MQYKQIYRIVFILGFYLIAQGQGPNSTQPALTATEIYEKYLAATGGMEARKSLQSLVIEGVCTFESNQVSHPIAYYTYSYKAPLSDALSVEMLGHGISWTGHRNGEPFRRTTIGGQSLISGIDTTIGEQDLYSFLEWNFSSGYSQMDLIGTTRIDGKQAYAVKFTGNQQQDPVIRYYDTETFLVLRADLIQRIRVSADDPGTSSIIETYFSNYHDYGQLKLPQIIAFHVAQRNLLFKVNKVKIDPKISDSAFH